MILWKGLDPRAVLAVLGTWRAGAAVPPKPPVPPAKPPLAHPGTP
jgi:hypothetical protein